MAFKTLAALALGGLIASFAFNPSAQAAGDIWIEGSYEFLDLPDVNFVNDYRLDAAFSGAVRQEFVNDDGDFDGFRIDGGMADIPVMGGAYMVGVRGFFAWHDDNTDIDCRGSQGVPGGFCLVNPLINNPNVSQVLSITGGFAYQFSTEKDVDHWGVAVDIAQGQNGFRAGPAFRRIDQSMSITGRETNSNAPPDLFQLTYTEDLETNYWGGFVGFDGSIDLGGGWSLQGDAEAGLYWGRHRLLGKLHRNQCIHKFA